MKDKRQIAPADEAAAAIRQVMAKGSDKDGCDESWRELPQDYHLDRALRHALTYKLIRDGNQKPDGEEHLKLAIARLAMALATAK